MGSVKTNPLPQKRGDPETAKMFGDYFINKITCIIDSLDFYPKFLPTQNDNVIFQQL
jgi:hypothetical protein